MLCRRLTQRFIGLGILSMYSECCAEKYVSYISFKQMVHRIVLKLIDFQKEF